VLHVVHRFDTGGLENGIVNLINHMPSERYRHAVLAVTAVTDFRHRIRRDDVQFHALHKPPGQGLWVYPKFLRLLADWRPAVVHTRNFGTLEFQLPAALARVPARVHGEHGRDIDDLDGSSRRHRWGRRLYGPCVQHYIALSNDLADYLRRDIGVAPDKVSQVYNGVDSQRFHPAAQEAAPALAGCPFQAPEHWLVGTVGRMQPVKNQLLLARAFVRALAGAPALRSRLRLVMIGDGPLRAEAQALLAAAGCADLAWLPGERSDVPDVMRTLQAFVLPSLAEGVSNTILEAMACGLPVVATPVGANAELVRHEATGLVLPPGFDEGPMAEAIIRLATDPVAAAAWGAQGRQDVVQRFSMAAMAERYAGVYDRLLGRRSGPR
jgi:sugar transferase (PEP-CTERM/EpsH1 system associated)